MSDPFQLCDACGGAGFVWIRSEQGRAFRACAPCGGAGQVYLASRDQPTTLTAAELLAATALG